MMALAVPPSQPEVSWFQATIRPESPERVFEVGLKSTAIRVVRFIGSEVRSTWVHRGKESTLQIPPGGLCIFPADNDFHLFRTQGTGPWECQLLWIPDEQVARIASEEGVGSAAGFTALRGLVDPSIERLFASATGREPDTEGIGRELAARALVIQMARIMHGAVPEWHSDPGAFNEATVRELAAYVDEHLHGRVRLTDMAALTGLSPGHFAKKLQRSIGLTAPAFVNHRRVRRAMDLLRDDRLALGRIADDLGFSSQSHFNRVFAKLTGLTPLKARKMLAG